MPRLTTLLVLMWTGLAAPFALAQSTGGAFGPEVSDGQDAVQLRIGIDPGDEDYATRLHYQRVLNDAVRWRVTAQIRDTAQNSTDLDYLQTEVLWQITPDGNDWQTGLRFDARIRDGSERPDRLALNWTNSFRISEKYSARAIILSTVEVGKNADKGVGLQARARLARRLPNRQSVGMEWFSILGTTQDFPALKAQRHQIGPYYNRDLGEKWSLYTSVLFGATDPATDVDIRVWINRRL